MKRIESARDFVVRVVTYVVFKRSLTLRVSKA